MGILGFLYIVFMVVFGFCLLATAIGIGAAIFSGTDAEPVSDEDVMFNVMLVVSGVSGMVLSGIGWSICIIAERLANRGLL